MLTKSPIILPLSNQQTPAISPHYWYSQFVTPQLFPLPPPGSLYRGTTECFTCTAILAQIPGISPALFLSLDTESISFDHHLRCCGCTVGTICEGKSTTVTHFYGCPLPPCPPCPRMAHRSTPRIHVEKITILLNSRNVILARRCCSI